MRLDVLHFHWVGGWAQFVEFAILVCIFFSFSKADGGHCGNGLCVHNGKVFAGVVLSMFGNCCVQKVLRFAESTDHPQIHST